MYPSGAVNFPISIPPPNYSAPAPVVQGNIPFQQFAPPFYPPAASTYNYYQNTVPYNGSNAGGNNTHPIHSYSPNAPVPLFSQPPPGYAANGNHMGPNSSNHVTSYQPVHMANVCSSSFNGFRAPNLFTRPPPAIPIRNDVQKNAPNRFTNYGNHRALDAKNSPYFCEACDKGFLSMTKFKQHNAEHVTCGQEGCTFSAHSKIVEKHFLMQHRSGLFKRIVKGNSPEEIQKWINERKKHFPTKDKIEVKNAQREEMTKRGERYAEPKRKFNERNSNFRPGFNGRYDRNAPHRNGQFRSGRFGQRKNLSRIRTNNRHRPENKGKDLTLNEDEDCFVRNLPPFKGTVYYQNMENDSSNEPEEHIITDDDIFTLSGDDDDVTVIDYDDAVVNEKVISEIEKCSETSNDLDDLEKDCSAKYFLNCDTADEKSTETDNCDKIDINDSMTETPNLPNDPPISHSDEVKESIHDTTVSKSVGALALIQGYDSDSEDGDNSFAQINCEVNSLPFSEIAPKSNHLSENCECDESLPKCIPVKENNTRNDSSPLKKIETEQTNDSSVDSEPEECSSKLVRSESTSQLDSSPVKTVNSEENNHTKPAASSSECAIVAEGDLLSSKEDETKGCESKRRKRKRRKNSKGGIEGEEETDEKPEKKLPPVLRVRKRYKPPTLLEKLLSNEINHERNVILQCIRHVANNNYFNVGESNSS